MRILISILFLISSTAFAAAPFDSLSIQGFLRTTGGTPVNGTYNGRVSLTQNAAPCWNSGSTLVPITITAGAFAKVLSGGVSSGLCSGALGSSHFTVQGPFTWTLALDVDGDNTVDTTFSNIPITAVPLAMVAETAISATTVTGAVPTAQLIGTIAGSMISGGAFGAVSAVNLTNIPAGSLTGSLPALNGSALTALNASNISTGTVNAARLGTGTADATTYLRGDGAWQSIPGGGEANTGSSLGAGSAVFKQKTGLDLQFRSMIPGSTKVAVAENTNDISIDVNEANLNLANIGGTLSGSDITGGTFGAVNGSALTSLNASNISTGTVAGARLGTGTTNTTTYLRGDSTWQTLPASGEANTGSSLGAGAAIFKQKTGLNLEFRSVVAGSTKISATQNANDVTVDINEANLSHANIGGTLSGSQVSGGTFGAVNGSALTTLNGSNITTGTVAAARLPVAGAAADGIVSQTAQTFAGAKTFSGAVTLSSTLANAAAVAWAKTDVATAATITCLASTTSVVRLTGTIVTSLQGISPGVSDGQLLVVYTDGNIGTGLTINHNNAGACANGRIFTNTNANVASITATSTAAFVFIYNTSSLRWHMISALQ